MTARLDSFLNRSGLKFQQPVSKKSMYIKSLGTVYILVFCTIYIIVFYTWWSLIPHFLCFRRSLCSLNLSPSPWNALVGNTSCMYALEGHAYPTRVQCRPDSLSLPRVSAHVGGTIGLVASLLYFYLRLHATLEDIFETLWYFNKI